MPLLSSLPAAVDEGLHALEPVSGLACVKLANPPHSKYSLSTYYVPAYSNPPTYLQNTYDFPILLGYYYAIQ